jgi:putative ABC transport system permease protein
MFKFELSEYLEVGRSAFGTLRAHKLRSSLTIVGIVVGVWTVMTNVSVITGIDVAVKKEIEFFGTRSIVISKFQPGINSARLSSEERARKKLTEADAAALMNLPSVELAVPLLNTKFDETGRRILVRGNGKTSATVELEGASHDYERAGVDFISEGRYFTKSENDTSQEVCVISAAAAETFFPFTSPVGKTLEVGGLRLRVLGVFEKREQTFLTEGGNAADVIVQYPLSLARKFQPEAEGLVILAVAYPGQLEEATSQITELLRARRQVTANRRDNFSATTADVLIGKFHSMSLGVVIVMSVVSSIALVVGGIGVMNIMLVSVTERTREIGVRKAVGARRRDILRQFLVEAMMLTSFGGLIGLLAGWLTTLCIGKYIPSYVPAWAPVAGLATSVGVGLIFGLWPAWKAARLDPVEAIRYD